MSYLNSFASLFELSVALNFAYVASDTIREVFKRGFLSTTRKLSSIIDTKIEKINVRLALIEDAFLTPDKKDKITNRLTLILNKFKTFDEKLDSRIEEAQKLTQNKLKSLHIIVAFYGIFILFLSGVEVVINRFPYSEFLTISFLVIFTILIIIYYSFKEKYPPLFAMIILVIIFIIVSIFFPFMGNTNLGFIPYRYLAYLSVLISFSPFIIIYIRLALTTAWIELQGWLMYLFFSIWIWSLNEKANKVEQVKEIF